MVPMLFAGLVLSGWNFLMLYSNVILLEAGFDTVSMVAVTLCLLMFQVIATLPGVGFTHLHVSAPRQIHLAKRRLATDVDWC